MVWLVSVEAQATASAQAQSPYRTSQAALRAAAGLADPLPVARQAAAISAVGRPWAAELAGATPAEVPPAEGLVAVVEVTPAEAEAVSPVAVVVEATEVAAVVAVVAEEVADTTNPWLPYTC